MLSAHFLSLAETRQYAKIKYSLHDVCMSGVAMMFFQDPSLLQFQIRMQEELHRNNLHENVRNRYPEIPWKEMAWMRDRLIHVLSQCLTKAFEHPVIVD